MGGKWLSITLFDNKKRNLDETDGWTYWHDLQKEPKIFFDSIRRNLAISKKFVMLWGAFGFNNQTTLAILSEKQILESIRKHLKKCIEIMGHYMRATLHI